MTVATSYTPVTYIGDAVTDTFNFSFPALAVADVWGLELDPAGGIVRNVQGTGGTVDLGLGTYEFVTPPAVGNTVAIYRKTGATQLIAYDNTVPLDVENIERGDDKLTYLAQEAQVNASVVPTDVADAVAAAQAAQAAAELAETNAETAETNAEAAEIGALSAQGAAEMARDSVYDVYIGEYANDGAANVAHPTRPTGALYFQTGNGLKRWDGASWSLVAAITSDFLAKDGSVVMTGALQAGGFRLTGIGDPTLAQDAATKAYVDVARIERKASSNQALGSNPSNVVMTFLLAGDMATVGGLSWDNTNHRIILPAGTWRMTLFVLINTTTVSVPEIHLYRSGTVFKRLYQLDHAALAVNGITVSVLFDANGTDYFDVRASAAGGGVTVAYGAGDAATRRITFERVAHV